jgi:hypothetical protein
LCSATSQAGVRYTWHMSPMCIINDVVLSQQSVTRSVHKAEQCSIVKCKFLAMQVFSGCLVTLCPACRTRRTCLQPVAGLCLGQPAKCLHDPRTAPTHCIRCHLCARTMAEPGFQVSLHSSRTARVYALDDGLLIERIWLRSLRVTRWIDTVECRCTHHARYTTAGRA